MQLDRLRLLGFGMVFGCAGLVGRTALAQELCGIDDIFNNGFEAASFIPTSQLPGGVQSPGLTQDITGSGALNVAITSPGSGATTGNSNVDVVGTYTGPANTGIVVNGIAGYAINGQFLVPDVPLNAGANALNVTATILPGSTATATVSITQSSAAAGGEYSGQSSDGLCTRADYFYLRHRRIAERLSNANRHDQFHG